MREYLKRGIICLLVLLLALSATGAFAGEYLGTMRVVNCQEWVSLRCDPDAGSERLAQVPLGAFVEAYYVNNEFTRCYYGGLWGYIKSEYLALEEEYDPIGLGSVEQELSNSDFFERYPDYVPFSDDYASTSHTAGWSVWQLLLTAGGTQNYVVVNCNSYVSLRVEADDQMPRILEVPLGQIVHAEGTWHEWTLCEYQGRFGWIKSKYLAPSDEYYDDSKAGSDNFFDTDVGYSLGMMYVVNCEEWISLWERPDTNSVRLETIPLGTCLEAYQVDKYFAFVEYNGSAGFVLVEYLGKNPPVVSQDPSFSSPHYGNWSDWSDAVVTPSATRQVETRTVYGYYYYYCPACGNHIHVYDYGDPSWCGGCGYTGSLEDNWERVFTENYYDYDNPAATLNDWHGTGRYYYNDPENGRLFAWIHSGNPTPYGKTQYRYRDLES